MYFLLLIYCLDKLCVLELKMWNVEIYNTSTTYIYLSYDHSEYHPVLWYGERTIRHGERHEIMSRRHHYTSPIFNFRSRCHLQENVAEQ